MIVAAFLVACNIRSANVAVESTHDSVTRDEGTDTPTTTEIRSAEGHEYYHCLSVYEPDITVHNVAGMTELEIARTLFGQYLQGYQLNIVPAVCKLKSFEVKDVSIAPELEFFREERGVDMMAWVTYSVQAASPGYWLAGNGVSGEDGWVLDKSMIVGLTRVVDDYKLTIHGTGP